MLPWYSHRQLLVTFVSPAKTTERSMLTGVECLKTCVWWRCRSPRISGNFGGKVADIGISMGTLYREFVKTAEPIEMPFGPRFRDDLCGPEKAYIRWGQGRTNPLVDLRGDKTAMRPFVKILWALVLYCFALWNDGAWGCRSASNLVKFGRFSLLFVLGVFPRNRHRNPSFEAKATPCGKSFANVASRTSETVVRKKRNKETVAVYNGLIRFR